MKELFPLLEPVFFWLANMLEFYHFLSSNRESLSLPATTSPKPSPPQSPAMPSKHHHHHQQTAAMPPKGEQPRPAKEEEEEEDPVATLYSVLLYAYQKAFYPVSKVRWPAVGPPFSGSRLVTIQSARVQGPAKVRVQGAAMCIGLGGSKSISKKLKTNESRNSCSKSMLSIDCVHSKTCLLANVACYQLPCRYFTGVQIRVIVFYGIKSHLVIRRQFFDLRLLKLVYSWSVQLCCLNSLLIGDENRKGGGRGEGVLAI